MIIGFTGTQNGMTRKQGESFLLLIRELGINEFHHGDCIGADAQAHKIVSNLTDAQIMVHPPDKNIKRAFCKSNNVAQPLPYLERNKIIVNESNILIATPNQYKEVLRSGTWSTIRYAKKSNKTCYIIFPDGNIEICNSSEE
jgi:hypothetical protein